MKSLDVRPRRRVIPEGRETNKASHTLTPSSQPGQRFQATHRDGEPLVSRRQSWEGRTPVWPQPSSGETRGALFSRASPVLACEDTALGRGRNHPEGLVGKIPRAPTGLGIALPPTNHSRQCHNFGQHRVKYSEGFLPWC